VLATCLASGGTLNAAVGLDSPTAVDTALSITRRGRGGNDKESVFLLDERSITASISFGSALTTDECREVEGCGSSSVLEGREER
jgi:hypothetical protein